MKILFAFILVAALLQTQAQPANETRFHCNVPDDWLFGHNGAQNIFPGTKWPGAVVKYVFHITLTDNDKIEAQRAFDDIQSKTCIRFEPRGSEEAAYTSIEVDDSVCGLGHLCRTGGYQFAQFGGGCREWNTMVHELGHNLCLGHEMSRKDRDDFVHFDGCASNEIPGKDEGSDLRGSLYDYASQMHYQCGWCPGGWPTQAGASKCGRDIQQGLSVLDADKLNDLYECGGCLAHRWKPIDALSDADRQSMLEFGLTETGQPLYACRGPIGGEIAIGKYSPEFGICYIPYGGAEYEFHNNAQVFTWPSVLTEDGELKQPKIANVTGILSGKIKAEPIRSGRTVDGVTGYIAVADIEFEGKKEKSIGKVFESDWSKAFFAFWGKELEVFSFGIVVC